MICTITGKECPYERCGPHFPEYQNMEMGYEWEWRRQWYKRGDGGIE